MFTDDFLPRDASVLLRLSFPPYEEEGGVTYENTGASARAVAFVWS